MRPRPLAALLTGALAAWAWLAPAPTQPVAAAPLPRGPLQLAVEASMNAAKATQSATGVATFEYHQQLPGDNELRLFAKGRMRVYYDRGKYHLRLRYDERDGWGPHERAVIFDGETAQVVYFSKRIRPAGCEVWVHRGVRESGLDIPTDPAQLWREFGNIAKLPKSPDIEGLKVAELGGGAARLTYRLKGAPQVSRLELEVGPASGYNPTRFRVFLTGWDEPLQDYTAEWAKAGGAWYVRRLTQEFTFRREGGITRRKSVIRYEEFEVNAKVGPKLFTLGSLNIPAGTRTLDHRPKPTPMAGPPAGH